MVDFSSDSSSEAFSRGLAATGVSGRSIFSQPEEPARLDQATVDTFTTIANKYGVPADVLLGLAEKDSGFNEFNRSRGPGSKVRGIINVTDEEVARGEYNPYDTAQNVEAAARKLRSYMQAGASVEEAVMAHAGGPDRSKWSPEVASYAQDVLARSARLSETYYPGMAPRVAETETKIDPATGRPTPLTAEEVGRAYNIAMPEASVTEDMARQFEGGAIKGAGSIMEGAAQASNEIRRLSGLPEYRSMANAIADRWMESGKQVERGVSDETKKAITDSSPEGDISKPSTWTLGKNPSLPGYFALGLDVFGGMLPVVAAAVGGGVVGGAIVGGLQGGGAAAQGARETINKMATTPANPNNPDGPKEIEQQSSYYQELIKQGKTPEQALNLTRSAAERYSFLLTTPVSALGGAAEGIILSPASKIFAGNAASRIAGKLVLGAAEEGIQETGEQVAQNVGTNVGGGTNIDPMQDTFGNFILGVIGGGGTGGSVGALQEVADRFGRKEPAPEDTTTRDPSAINAAVVAPLRAQESLAASAGEPRDATAMGAAGRAPAAAERVLTETSNATRDPSTMREPVLEASVTAAPEGVAPAASTDAIKKIAAEAPGRQTAADLRDIESAPKPATARPGGQGPLSRVLDAGAPSVAPLATAAGQRVVLSDETGSISGIVVGQDAEGIMFKDDTGFEQLIENDLITSGKVSIAPEDAAPTPAPAAPDPFAMTPDQRQAEEEYYAGQTTAVATPTTENSNLAAQAAATIPTKPTPAPTKPSLSDMSEEELRAKLKYIAGQGKANGWNPLLIKAHKEVERAINGITSRNVEPTPEAPVDAATAQQPEPSPIAVNPSPEPLVDEEPTKPPKRADAAKIAQLLRDFSLRSPKAMQSKLENNGLTDTHEVYEMPDKGDGISRFGIREKAAPQGEISPPAPEAVEIPAAPAPKTEGEISPKAETATKPIQKQKGDTKDGIPIFDVGVPYSPAPWRDVGEGFKIREHYERNNDTLSLVQEIQEPQSGVLSRGVDENGQEKWFSIEGFGSPFDRNNPGNPGNVEKRIRDFIAKRGATKKIDAPSPAPVQEPLTTEPSGNAGELEAAQEPPTAAEAPAPAPATDQIPDTGKKAAKPKRDAKRRAEKKGKTTQSKETTNAAQEGLKPEDNQQQYQDGNGGRKTTEAGRSDSNVSSRQSQEAISKEEVKPSTNTVFTDDAYAAAVARFNKRHKGSQFNSGIDPEDLADGIIMAGYHIEKGARTFSAYAETMLETLGEKVRPFLKSWYLGVKFDPRGASFDGMDSAGAVEAFDLASLNGERNEPAKLDKSGAGPLERVPADTVQGATEGRETGAGAETSGGADVSGTGRVGEKRNGPAGSVGNGQGTLSLSPGGTELKGTERRGAGGERGGETIQRNLSAQERNATGRDGGGLSPEPTSGQLASNTAADFAISDEDKIGEGGKKTKFKQNVAAIKIVKRLAETGEPPTAEDQKALAKYVGWGGVPEAFERSNGEISKGWEKEAKELKELLTADEYAEAAASTQYAHYTAPEVVKAMWDGIRRMGFNGGRLLEPGMGVGNFFGLMPADLRAASALHGVEKDIITGGVAKGLYPAAKIAAPVDFREYSIPDGYFDAAIGNPPFASTKITDTANRDISGFSLHNYFFAKTLNGLKPGGVMSMVVTSRMLDSISDKSRQYMADRADLVAAIRLPNNAFLKNAGTQVTTDIIILRKRKEGENPSGESWATVGNYTNEKGETLPLNEYFIRHPENMLGEFGPYGSMYNPDEPALIARKGQDTPALLREAMNRLPENITSGSAVEVAQETPIKPTSVEHVRIGSAFIRDGKVMVREQDRLGEPQASEATFPSEKAKERVVGMIGVRDAFAKLRSLQLNAKATDKEIAKGRQELNEVYDAFVKKNGFINEEANKRLFRDDPSWPQIAALEDDFQKGVSAAVAKSTGQQASKPSAKKAAIFTRRTQAPYSPVTSASTAKDALVASLSERGRIDLDLMQKLYGKDGETILKELGELVFNDPIRGPVTREEYLSGNVKAKLGQAMDAARRDSSFQRNVDALQAVQPKDVDAIDIDVKVGSHWIPQNVMEDFASHILGVSKVQTIYNPVNSSWTVRGDASADAATRWGTSRARASDVIEAAANQRTITIRDQQSDGTSVLNEVDTQAANDKVQAVKDEWKRWIFEDDARREKLAMMYNEMFNTNIAREFDGSHLTFPGKVGDDVIRLRPHQANAVWRALQSSTTLFDHVVGAGKTFTMVAAAMEMRRMGLAKKPMFIVPNHLVGQWASDFVKLYPNANILAATKKDFEKENRKKLFARIATGDWDAVIVAHSSFGKVEVDPKDQSEFIELQVKDLIQTEEAMRAEEGKNGRNVKQIQNRIATLREKQKRLLDTGAKDDSLYWKELGVDALFLDEAHEFKNLEFSTSMQRVAGLGNQQGSQKASDLYLKLHQVLEATGGRNIVFATGTPISNTMAEMFTMQRYLDGKALREQGLGHFDAWARMYGEVVTDWELSPSGTYKLNSRFAKFVNMPELMQRYTSFADVINRDDINEQLKARGEKLPVPNIKGGKPQNIVVKRSPDQAAYIGEPNENDQYPNGSLVWRAENLPKKVVKGGDNMLKIMSDARKAALDMRLIDPSYPDYPGSKVNVAADRIKEIYDKWDADKGAQLVFIDLSTPKSALAKEAKELRDLIDRAEAGDEDAQQKLDAKSPDELLALESKFSVYDDLKQKLIDRGIPENEIAFIHSANTEQQKEELFGRVKSGRIRVLFGSTAKMGAGMNVQERLVALHHLDAPWRPSDLEQREGRIIRQGNVLRNRDPDNFEVEINRYAAKGTLDSRMWQTIEGKARFIEQVRKGNDGSREIEDIGGEAANAAEMKAAASGNPLILEEMTLRQRVKKLENEERAHMQEQWGLSSRLKWEKSTLETMQKRLENLREDVKLEIPKDFVVSIRGQQFDKRKDAGEQILKEAEALRASGAENVVIGSYGGFKLGLHIYNNLPNLFLQGAGQYETTPFELTADPQGVGQRIVNAGKETRSADELKARIANQKSTIEKMEAQQGKWPKAEELAEARARHGAVIAKLKPKQKPAETPTEEPKASIGRSSGMSARDLTDALTRGKDGSIIKALLDSGKVVIETTGEGMPDGAQAATMPDGTIRLVAGYLDASTARGVLLHEAFHAGGETLLGSAGFRALLRRVQTAADNAKPGSWAAEAKARAEAAGTPSAHMAEEIAAYAIEHAENAPAGIREIADRIVGAVKAFILRKFGKQIGAVTPGQLRALAASALRAGAPVGETQTQDGVRYSIASTASAAKAKGKTAFERATNAASDFLTQAMVGGGARPGQFSSLALAPVRALFTELAEGMPSARGYLDTKQAMDAFRNEMNTADDALLQDWLKWGRKNKTDNSRLMDVMHDSTLAQYDPTLTDKEAAAKGQIVDRAVKEAYDTLPKEAKEFYAKIRDAYSQRSKDVEEQVVANVKKALTMITKNAQRTYDDEMARIKDEGLTGKDKLDAEKAAQQNLTMAQTRLARNKAARIKRMREYFENNRLKGPYFPLARFGNYFVTLRDGDGKVLSFEKYASRSAQRARAEELRGLYGKDAVQESTAQYETKEARNVDPGFLASVDTILDEAGVDMGVRDAIYQTYLQTMPDLSMRKASIHRKGTPGFDKDAVRGYAHNMFHSAHQLSRLRYGMDLQDHLAEAAKQVRDSDDPIRTQAVYNEMVKSHEFTMNPDGSPLAHYVTSAVFLWTMAFNLSTAMVNTMQSVNVGIPNIAFDVDTAGNAGIRKATRAMADAGIDFVRGKGSVLNSGKLSADERAAVTAAYDSGLIDSTQAHDLAGVAESGISYRPGVQRFMRAASLPMHHTERFNREVTFLAAYRVARDAGLDHVAGIKKASDQTWATHFDNQSNAKPRFARGQLGKMLFALKSYQANFVYRIFRDLHQALEGKTEAERKTALKRFASMFALTAAAAGIRGAFFYSTVMAIMGAFMGLAGNDDDDPDEIVRKFVIEHVPDAMIGHAVAGVMLDGIPGYLTGTSLTNRVQDMWSYSNDRDLNADQQWTEWTTQFLGVGAGIVFQLWKGKEEIEKGNIERGVEKMLPAALRNVAKAVRYFNEGVQDKYGNPIVDNVPLQDVLKQAIGFTPAEIADRFARNTYQRNRQDQIEAKATDARKAVARAMRAGDAAAEAEGRKAVDKFNAKYPEYQIRPKSIMQSMRNMENRKDRMEFGVDLNKKLSDRIKAGTAPSIYAR